MRIWAFCGCKRCVEILSWALACSVVLPKGQNVNRWLSNFWIEIINWVNAVVCVCTMYIRVLARSTVIYHSKWKEKGKRSTKHSNLHAHAHTRAANAIAALCLLHFVLYDDENTVTHTDACVVRSIGCAHFWALEALYIVHIHWPPHTSIVDSFVQSTIHFAT